MKAYYFESGKHTITVFADNFEAAYIQLIKLTKHPSEWIATTNPPKYN